MKALRQKHGLDEEQTIVEQGLPEDVIPAAAERLNAAMVILGTTGRTGLSAVFIGNTAEHVIDKINCDVLALKPKGTLALSTQIQQPNLSLVLLCIERFQISANKSPPEYRGIFVWEQLKRWVQKRRSN